MSTAALQTSPVQDLSGWVVLLLVPLLSLFVAQWVYRDARARGSEWAWQWAVATALGLLAVAPGVVVVVVYLLVRDPVGATGTA